jgi:hypothetical protein
MKKNPPLRFVKSQIINEIANHSLKLLDLEKAGKINSAEFLAQSFPANAIQTIDKAIANAIDLFNSKESNNEN